MIAAADVLAETVAAHGFTNNFFSHQAIKAALAHYQQARAAMVATEPRAAGGER